MTAVSRQPSTGHISRKPSRGPAPRRAAGFSRHDSVESRMTTVSRKSSMGPAPKRAAGFPSVVHNDSAESRMTAVSRKPSMGPIPRGGAGYDCALKIRSQSRKTPNRKPSKGPAPEMGGPVHRRAQRFGRVANDCRFPKTLEGPGVQGGPVYRCAPKIRPSRE